ncbi:MAG: SusD/RagB family nutrient-binding outer membrane lipoprotein [Niabella sp.]|nr:SusD/RagB family nutrient-binding outer membrane lipoprotein [Niabella sp.]
MKRNLNTYSINKRTGIATGVLALLLSASSCTKDFEKINTPYKDVAVSTASPVAVFNQLARNATNEDYTLYTGLFMPITNQQGVQNVSIPYTNYISSFWNNYYPDLANYKLLVQLINASASPAAYNNLKSIATIMIASKTLSMLDRYGSIPYSKAGVGASGPAAYQPAYDDEASVYTSVLGDLATAVNTIKSGAAASDQIQLGSSESFLNNNYDSWVKFGNALRLRYAVRLFAKNAGLATPIITDIIGGNKPLPSTTSYASMEDMRQNNYGTYPQLLSTNPSYGDRFWYAFREVSVTNIRLSSNVWNQISATNATDGSGIYDPRAFVWFMPNNAGKWVAQAQDKSQPEGSSSLYPNTSSNAPAPPNTLTDNKFSGFNFYLVRDFLAFPYVTISEADVHFLKAEIYARGMGVAADFTKATQEYNAGLTASVNFWYTYVATTNGGIWPAGSKPTLATGALAAFLANPNVALVVGDNTGNLKKIITQAWLAALWESPEAWAIVRRTGLAPKDPNYSPQVFNKLPYPNDEAVNNKDNWMKMTNGANPDDQAKTKVYWMP